MRSTSTGARPATPKLRAKPGAFSRAALFTVMLAGPFCGLASAVSVDDLVNLKAHGLADAILIALIESDGSRFTLTADDVVALHQKGLSDAVLVAMIRTNRVPPPAPAVPSTPVAPVVVTVNQTLVEHHVVDRPVPVLVPVVVPVEVEVPVRERVATTSRQPDPTYWGFGGARRPDTWGPSREPERPTPPKASSPPKDSPSKDRDDKPSSPSRK